MPNFYFSFFVAAALALVHVFAGKLRFLDVVPRSRWLSFGGGISVAYVFIHLLPELENLQDTLQPTPGHALAFIDHHVYLIALLGLAIFYGIESSTRQSRKQSRESKGDDVSSPQMFWISTGAFACYNALIGYLLVSDIERSVKEMLLFALAMALHFITNDFSLRHHHKHLYTRYGRWLLCGAIVVGAAAGRLIEIEHSVLAIMVSFLAGGIILNVLKEELPDDRESRFSAFALGTAGYTALLLAV